MKEGDREKVEKRVQVLEHKSVLTVPNHGLAHKCQHEKDNINESTNSQIHKKAKPITTWEL